MKKFVLLVAVLMVQCFYISAHAYQIGRSGRNEIWDNPFIAYGYNPKTKVLTGYLAALRTAPGRTDECKLVFAGDPNEKKEFLVSYIGGNTPSAKQKRIQGSAFLVMEQNTPYLKFHKKDLRGECDWILPFVVESEVSEDSDEVTVEMAVQYSGSWIAVHVIGAHKANFHSRPDGSVVQKPYLVKGDVIYVYDEIPDWYFVKYKEGKKKIDGWIKKADTLQP